MIIRPYKELGLWCAEQVRKWGGILEQPAHSRLWEAAGLPRPGSAMARRSIMEALGTGGRSKGMAPRTNKRG